MAQADIRVAEAGGSASSTRAPTVLVVLVSKDGEPWLRQCLIGLSRQTHPRLGVLAVDNASTDGSAALLEQALGTDRVMRLERNVGFSSAVAAALQTSDAAEADYVLLLHDDAVLAPEAIAHMAEAADRIDGVGIVGPKVLDWEEPRLLREIGMSSDRFGYPSSPLEDGEIDQGQYDRVREVMFVSSCAMLVSRGAWTRIGFPDERFESHHEDLDFCWRARVAGFRVLMTPAAEARHREASLSGERPSEGDHGLGARYERERAALASLLKNYGLLSLLWVLPLYAIQGVTRVAVLTVTRRFGDAYQILAAWGWNVAHLPGTVVRRFRTQSRRKARDRDVRRYMAPAGDRLRRWAATARQALLPPPIETEADEEGEAARVPLRAQVARLALGHPVAAAWVLAAILATVAYRNLFGASTLAGGALQVFPHAPSDFLRELGSGLRHTGLGGSQAASPALGLLGLGSILSLGSPALLQKILVLLLPALAGATCYRAVRSLTGTVAPAAMAGACYALSAAALWGVSEGRLPALVFLAGLPWLSAKLLHVFDASFRTPAIRWIAGSGLGLAVLASFYPGAFLAAILVTACAAVLATGARARLRGVAMATAGLVAAAVLALPVTLAAIGTRGGILSDSVGLPSFGALVRTSLGGAPGSWVLAAYLPVAAALGLAFVARSRIRQAVWAALVAVASLYLAWLAGAGYLPMALSNPVALVGLAAFAYSALVGLGLASLSAGVERESFGHRQLGGAAMLVVLGAGLLGQAGQAGNGAWRIGGAERLPLAYPLVGQPALSGYRVLWLGPWTGGDLPPPAGLPEGRIAAGEASVSFAVTGPGGASILDAGRGPTGPGYEILRRVMSDVLAGDTRHGGALLSTFGIRFVVGRAGDLPPAAVRRLSTQLDLDRTPAGDLIVFRDRKAVPLASVVLDQAWAQAARANGGEQSLATLPSAASAPFDPAHPVPPARGLVFLSQQYSGDWRLTGPTSGPALRPERAFGWAVGWQPSDAVAGRGVGFGGQRVRDVELGLLALLWAASLWVTRRPSRG